MRTKSCLIVALILLSLGGLGLLCAGVGLVVYRTASAPSGEVTVAPQGAPGAISGEGALRLYGAPPPTLDPAMVQDSTSAEYVVHLFSGLVSLNHALDIVPDLAEGWEVSADGLTYTFTLRPEATFADGRALTAEDVIYSFERACSPALGSPVALSYLEDIVGATAYAGGQAQRIAGLRAVDAHTLEIAIDAPKAYFLAKLTYPVALVVDRRQTEGGDSAWMRSPNGSGPFVLQSISRDAIVLARNERYYRERPALERVEFVLRGGLPIAMYENDELDMAGVGPYDVERILDPENPLHGEYVVSPEMSVQYIGLNVNRPPFDDPLVRQAFAYAIDRGKIAELVLKGTAMPARGILPPGLLAEDAPSVALSYDPAQARALLAQSRYGAPGAMPELILAVSGESGAMSSIDRALLHMLEQNLGLEVTIEQVAWADFLQDLNIGRYQMFSAGWIGDYPDPQNFLDLLFHSASAQNHTGYANATVDALLEEARVEADHARRMALYAQAEKIIVSEAPWAPLTHGVSYMLVKPYVQGFHSSASLYPWLADIRLER